MTDAEAVTAGLPPVERRFSLRRPPAEAFSAFTEQVGEWWPAGFTGSGDKLAAVTVEPFPGGRVFESDTDGNEQTWGSVLRYEPGRRLTLAWRLGLDTDSDTELDVAFDDAPEGTAVRFVHGGFDTGQEKDREKFADEGGWDVVLGCYRQYADVTGG